MEGEMRNEAIAILKFTFDIVNHLEEELENGKELLETLKVMLEDSEDELRLINRITSRVELVGEIVRPLQEDRFVVKGSEGVSYVVSCCDKVDKSKLVSGTRVTLQPKTLKIMRILPPKVNPSVYNMVYRARGDVRDSELGGLSDQLRDLRDYIELPLINPEIFKLVGVKPPKAVLLHGPPGTGKTLLAKAVASNTESTFLTVASSALVSSYMGDSQLLVREIFKYARDHQPCIIFMDEIDAIGRHRSNKESANCHGLLIELLSQLDGFNELDKVKVIMATNRPDDLDPALLRPGRIDKKIEVPLPNQTSRMSILKIHAAGITKQGEIDYERIAKLSEGFNGADMRNICTEAGMLAMRAKRDYVVPNDFILAVRKLGDAKKLESSAQYN